ncbi:MAG TPA: carboxymuconolactone decarboxylase family protein [Dehalococcoidia bacterium]|nr:carboxymuconolactone decarboxylase family protein [Dehalococcoidia bacterium]
MTTLPNPGTWQATLQKSAPELYQSIMGVRNEVLVEGALPLKVKVLMTMLCDALLAHEEGVHNIANRARAVGATEEEIAETVGVAFLMGGTPALVTAVNAFKK